MKSGKWRNEKGRKEENRKMRDGIRKKCIENEKERRREGEKRLKGRAPDEG